jgi:hypothetical protein
MATAWQPALRTKVGRWQVLRRQAAAGLETGRLGDIIDCAAMHHFATSARTFVPKCMVLATCRPLSQPCCTKTCAAAGAPTQTGAAPVPRCSAVGHTPSTLAYTPITPRSPRPPGRHPPGCTAAPSRAPAAACCSPGPARPAPQSGRPGPAGAGPAGAGGGSGSVSQWALAARCTAAAETWQRRLAGCTSRPAVTGLRCDSDSACRTQL